MNQRNILISLFLLLFNFLSYSQETCKVLIPEIAESYIGKCKKGLAHGKGEATGIDFYKGRFTKGFPDGKGEYTWANGNIYTGGWTKGKRDGEGSYSFVINGKDSILSGIWESDQYKGPKPKAPTVSYNRGVKRYSFKKQSDLPNSIELKIMRGGGTNSTVSQFNITSSTGVEKGLRIESVVYPVKVTVRYMTLTTLNTMSYQVSFDFEITEPGSWYVILHN